MTATRTNSGHRLGFTSLEDGDEVAVDQLPLSGELPDWLAGNLIRTGPAQFEVGGRSLNHWFDGLAMLHRFAFEGGRVAYRSRFLDSHARRAANETGELALREFATDPCRSLFKRAQSLFRPDMTDNGNVNVAKLGDELIAMSETPMPLSFDPETLATLGVAYTPPGQHPTAHPHHDPARGELLNHAAHFGARSSYRVYSVPDAGPRQPRTIATIPAAEPAYMHSFAISERYLVVTEQPYVANPLKLALSGRPFIANYEWRPERGTRFHVIDRIAGEPAGTFQTDAFFVFHHVNAFEDGGDLVVDLCAFDDPEIVEALYLGRAREEHPRMPVAELRRYRIDLNGGGVTSERLADEPIELPRIAYRTRNGRPYSYVWGAGQREQGGFFDQIVKVDVGSRTSTTWHEPGTHPGEPVFVPAPDGAGEDDGVLLSVLLEPARGRSSLLVLDAADLTELARADAPHHIPFSFHGQFFR
ncbi:MAG: beta,beta-carotene 9,10-dioxygenase [Thermoleophilaceae bacterium]|nr:beta,beta-carotene 9,10-dioxygenase [Thermoleophilaceae bacterium]